MQTTKFKINAAVKQVMILAVIALMWCGSAAAQKTVRIWPKQGGDWYEEIVPQGYEMFSTIVKDIMWCIPNKESCNYDTTFNWGDDEIMNTEADFMFTHQMDLGKSSNWYESQETFLNSSRSGSLYLKAWFNIYKINECLQYLDQLTDCTASKKDEIEGDLYFLRAWWHQELMTYFGPMPYVDYQLEYDKIVKLPCLTAKECAEKCAEDFDRAAAKLPIVALALWSNDFQNQSEAPNRLAALAYKGKVLLWAASPLNYLGAQIGALANGNTYRYDTALAEKAAEALGSALTLARGPQSPFELAGTTSAGQSVNTIAEQNFEGLTIHPFRSLVNGLEQYDEEGLLIHNETARGDNADVKYIVLESEYSLQSGEDYVLRVTIKASCAGSLDAHVSSSRGKYTEDKVACSIPFSEEWTTVDCDIDKTKIYGRQVIFCSGKTAGDIHIKSVKVIRKPTYGGETIFPNLFYTLDQGWKHPGAQEAVFANSNLEVNQSNWNFAKLWGPKLAGLVAHDVIIHQPTANYVNYAYGMANGLPITDPDSGFDPAHPYKNRDPRFYNDIVYDGYRYVEDTEMLNNEQKKYVYMQLYTGGNVRDEARGSRTGYFCKKLVPTGCNEGDMYYEWMHSLQCNLPYMRLADIYLMYAEACAAYGSATTSNGCTLTAEEAINVLRDRVGAGQVAKKYTDDSKLFMDEVRRERACELAFEGHRWSDLARWLLLTEEPYTKKTSQEFKRVGSGSNTAPHTNEVSDWSESVILTRSYDETYYTFPLDPNNPPETDIVYSEDGKTLISYPSMSEDETFTVPEEVEAIAENCFRGCSSLKTITLHDGIKTIGAGAFSGTGITEILIPTLVTSLPDRCFENTPLKTFLKRSRSAASNVLTIPASIESVGNSCFAGCSQIEAVAIENGVKSLGNRCFAQCDKVKEIHIPASVTHIGKACFSQGGRFITYGALSIGSLESITVDQANDCYAVVDGVLYDKSMTHLMQCPSLSKGEIVVPEGVEVIDSLSINSCPEVTRLILPSSLKTIEHNFNYCMRLTDIVFNSVDVPVWKLNVSNSIPSEYLTNGFILHVPSQQLDAYREDFCIYPPVVQVVPTGSETQYDAHDLVLLGLKSWNYTCDNQEIVTHIKEVYADGVKQDLSDVIVQNPYNPAENVLNIRNSAGSMPMGEVVLRMDDEFKELTGNVVFGCKKVILPETVKTYSAADKYFGDLSLTQIVLPESLEELGENGLYGFQGWTITIPENVMCIGEGTLVRSMLGEIYVSPENLHYTSVDGVLYDKDMKTLLVYPALKPEQDYAVPEGVETVRANAMAEPSLFGFQWGFNHNMLTLPASLKSVGEKAFECFWPKTVVCYAKNVPLCGKEAFGPIYSGSYYYGRTLYVPAGSVEAYEADEEWGKFRTILPIEGYDAIETPTAASPTAAKVIGVYGIDGIRTTQLRKGVNILRMSDGTARTILVRPTE